MIRVLIADDHLLVRQGLRMILDTEEDFEVVGDAGDGAEAITIAEELRPDVVLMDLRMPGMGGLEAIEQLQTQRPEIAVVILTTYNEDELMIRGLRAGARGFLLKDTNRRLLFSTIRSAARGETLLQPEILARVLAHTEAPTKASSTLTGNPDLTEREHEVLSAVSRGDRSKEIAYRLGVTERTVKAHLTNIYSKLGVDSRAAAVSVALQRGILPGFAKMTEEHL